MGIMDKAMIEIGAPKRWFCHIWPWEHADLLPPYRSPKLWNVFFTGLKQVVNGVNCPLNSSSRIRGCTGIRSFTTTINAGPPVRSKTDCWRTIWINILTKNRQFLDMSSVEFDGSHTPAKNGGDAVGYQGRKACNTTNALFMSDNQAGPPERSYVSHVHSAGRPAWHGPPRLTHSQSML